MPMNKSIIVTRPNHDSRTRYLCAWSEEVIKIARDRNMDVYDLKGKKSKRSIFESYINAKNPAFIFLNGHGNQNVITGHENEPIVDETSNLEEKIIYARSCDAGQILGHRLVENGSKSFIGYKRKFIWGYLPGKVTRPLEDDIARLFLEPSNLVASTLIKNHTTKEAHDRSKNAMYKNFLKMVSSVATYEERYTARWLWSNINSQVLLGDQEGRI